MCGTTINMVNAITLSEKIMMSGSSCREELRARSQELTVTEHYFEMHPSSAAPPMAILE